MEKIDTSWKWRNRSKSMKIDTSRKGFIERRCYFKIESYNSMNKEWAISLDGVGAGETWMYANGFSSPIAANLAMLVYKDLWNEGMINCDYFDIPKPLRDKIREEIRKRINKTPNAFLQEETINGTPNGFKVYYQNGKIVDFKEI